MAIQDYPFHIVKDPTTITATTIGLALTPALDGDGLSSLDDGSGPWLEHVTKDEANKSAGLQTGSNVVAGGWQPEVEMRVWTPSDTSTLLIWAGMFSARPDAIVSPVGMNVAAFRFEPSLSSQWQGVVNDGGLSPLAQNAGAFAPSTKYTLKVRIATQVEFRSTEPWS